MQEFSLDHLNETEFEEFCHDLLRELGFININWRKGTGFTSSPSDRGRDIECQHLQRDADGSEYLERWFVECKHYQQGVPPDKIQGALAWATSERPDKLLIIASNFLSNPTKDALKEYIQNNRPSFRIKYWEKPDIRRLSGGKPALLRRYRISGDLPFVGIMHPAHLLYLNNIPLNTLNYVFECLDGLDSSQRDAILSWAYLTIPGSLFQKQTTENETCQELPIHEQRYRAFKGKCHQLAHSGLLDGPMLAFLITSFSLQCCLWMGDTTAIDERVADLREKLAFGQENKEKLETARLSKGGIERVLTLLGQRTEELPQRIKSNYNLYVYFCENVVQRLLEEDFLSKR